MPARSRKDRREDVGAGIGAFVLTRSLLLADGAVFDNCARAIYARFGSQVNFRRGSARRCGWTAVQLQESYASCQGAVLTEAGHHGLRARITLQDYGACPLLEIGESTCRSIGRCVRCGKLVISWRKGDDAF